MRATLLATTRLLLGLLVAVAALVSGPSAAARADEPTALVRITLRSLTPALPQRDGRITVTGTVTNTSSERLYRLQAVLWRDQAPITSAESLQSALGSASNDPLGRRLTSAYADLYDASHPYLEPGQSASFRISAAVADLELPATDGLYLIGVHVLQNGNIYAVGRARTFVPVLDHEPAGSVQLTSLIVLGSRPSLLRHGVLLDDHLASEVRPGGRLDRLLTAADSDTVSFAVDPALVEELTTMRAGYTVDPGDGATHPGRGQADAASWLSRLEQLTARRDGFRLLYGSPDVAALVHGGQTAVLADAVEAGRRVAATSKLPLLVLPADGAADEETVAAAERLDPAAVVLSSTTTGGAGPLLTGPGEAPVVVASGTDGGGPGPDPRDTAVQLRQRLLADTWLEATSAAHGTVPGRVRVVTDANQVRGADAGAAAPWITRATLGALLGGTPARWSGDYSYPPSASQAELGRRALTALQRFRTSEQAARELLVRSDAATGQAAVARAASSAWRGDERTRRRFLDPQQAGLDDVLTEGVQISSNPKVSTVARQGVEFPITVKNLLPADPSDPDVNAVRVGLVFTSENQQRLTIRPLEATLIRAGSNVTRNARVTAKANGTVRVRAQLQTADGTPVGQPKTIDVRVTQNGTTGWAIAAAALVVFGGGITLHIRRVSRTRAAEAAAAAPPSGLSSAPPEDLPTPTDHRTPSDSRRA